MRRTVADPDRRRRRRDRAAHRAAGRGRRRKRQRTSRRSCSAAQGNNLNAYEIDAAVPPPARDHARATTTRRASTSTRRSASSPGRSTAARGGSSPARTPGSRTRRRAGGSSRCRATRSASSRPRRSASSRRPTRARLDNAENYGCGFLPRRARAHDRRRQPGDRQRRRPAHRLVPAVQPHQGPVLQDRHRHRDRRRHLVDARTDVYVASARPPTAGV